jgi:hypothetical protein
MACRGVDERTGRPAQPGVEDVQMLKWFKRRGAAAPASRQPAADPGARPAPRRAIAPTDPMPLPEVVAEGNTQADWSAWEDSMTTLNSQMQGLPPDSGFYVREHRDTRPSQLDEEPDAFGSVRGKRDV